MVAKLLLLITLVLLAGITAVGCSVTQFDDRFGALKPHWGAETARSCGTPKRPAVCVTLRIENVGNHTVSKGYCEVLHNLISGGTATPVAIGPRLQVRRLQPGRSVVVSGRSELAHPFKQLTFRPECDPGTARA